MTFQTIGVFSYIFFLNNGFFGHASFTVTQRLALINFGGGGGEGVKIAAVFFSRNKNNGSLGHTRYSTMCIKELLLLSFARVFSHKIIRSFVIKLLGLS